MLQLAGLYALSFVATILVLVGIYAICSGWFSEPKGLPNRVSESELLELQKTAPRNQYGETHEMFEMRLYRYWEELRKIEKRQNHLMQLIRISEWRPL